MLELEEDSDLIEEVKLLIQNSDRVLVKFELNHLLGGPQDKCGAILSINPGAGGTESMDWAGMLYRMYDRWADANGMKLQVLDYQAGDEAGIKSVTLEILGDYAYGQLKAEVGVHRLVRISPFDSNKRRHTSFASVFVYADVANDIDIVVNESDLRVDTYRASGAGGQHVNTTDSAVRITHIPTGVVAQCQNERSQHKNKATALKILKAALFEKERQEQLAEKDELNSQKKSIEWGSQVRSYVLHPYQMVKDHRTEFESSNTQGVLDGKLTPFIESYLKQNPSIS
ncbi:MAG: peptide chain release factor 2 [bacterium]